MTNYFDRSEVSNSDLTWLKKQLFPREMPDTFQAFMFGNLIDAMITEPYNVDFINLTCNGLQYNKEQFASCEKMKESFLKDSFCFELLKDSECQKVIVKNTDLCFKGIDYKLDLRCKYDLFSKYDIGADIKSTAATTLRGFISSIDFFDYDRQRALYMAVSGAKTDVVIGISKINYKVFKVPISTKSDIYKSGSFKLNHLGYKWNVMFGENKKSLQ